jgi:biopolymer transport protein ExbD
MPAHVAGPRLFSSIKLKVLGTHSGSAAGARPSNVYLNLTPFVDMMTILVSFLLMVFSSTGELLQAQAGLDLPLADNKDTLQLAPVIIVTKREITYQGDLVATIDAVMRDESPAFKIDALFERLDASAKKIKTDVGLKQIPRDLQKACDDAKAGLRPEPGKLCPDGLAILQADEGTDARLINKIVNTAKAAGFDNLLFAVKNK